MSRFNLPDINFVDLTPEELEELQVSKFEQLMDGEVKLDEADPRRAFLQAVAYAGYLIANNIDFTGKQTLLSYAEDFYLDHLGNKKKVPRLGATAATTTMRFESNAPRQFVIEKGTLMSINNLYFSAIAEVVVPSGPATVNLPFKCTETGEEGNGFLPNQISEIVEPDKIPYVSAAYNITKTAGGADIEDDDAYANRIQEAPEGYSTAGPGGAYEFHAKKASQNVADVKALKTAPGEVTVYLLMQGGALPTDEEKNKVLTALNADEVRPLTDLVHVSEPEQVPYSLEITYQAPDTSSGLTIQDRAQNVLNEYVLWQKSKFGRGIDPSELYARLQEIGAKRIIVTPNTYIKLTEYQVAQEDVINLVYGGVVND